MPKVVSKRDPKTKKIREYTNNDAGDIITVEEFDATACNDGHNPNPRSEWFGNDARSCVGKPNPRS